MRHPKICAPNVARSWRYVCYGIPAYDETVAIPTLNAIVSSLAELAADGTNVEVQAICGDALLPRSRNTLAALILKKEYDDMVMIDSDVGFESGAMKRILSHNVDLVAGLYPVRSDSEGYMLRWDISSDEKKRVARLDPKSGLLEVDSVPTGFFRITNTLMRKMAQAYDDMWYVDDMQIVPKAWNLFSYDVMHNHYWGEDFLFCQKWRNIEGKVWVDPWIQFSHTGKKTWTGCFGTYKTRETQTIARIQNLDMTTGLPKAEEPIKLDPREVSVEELQDKLSDMKKTEERGHFSRVNGNVHNKPVGPTNGTELPPGLAGYLALRNQELVQ